MRLALKIDQGYRIYQFCGVCTKRFTFFSGTQQALKHIKRK